MGDRIISGLVLATRSDEFMHSSRPKPLHMLCGKPMGSYVLSVLSEIGISQAAIVVNSEGTRISKRLMEDPPNFTVRFVEQPSVLGSGEAVLVGLSDLDDLAEDEDIVILTADLPLMSKETLSHLVNTHRSADAACTILSYEKSRKKIDPNNSKSFEVIRDKNDRVADLVDVSFELGEQDADTVELATDIYCVKRELLAAAIRRAQPSAGFLQIRDVVRVLSQSGHLCQTALTDSVQELTPIDDRVQLAAVEKALRKRTNRHWLSEGVTMVDPSRTYIDNTVTLGTDVTIFPGTILQGKTSIGNGARIGPDVKLVSCSVGQNTHIEYSVASRAEIGSECRVGPYSVLRPGAEVANGTTVSSFTETS